MVEEVGHPGLQEVVEEEEPLGPQEVVVVEGHLELVEEVGHLGLMRRLDREKRMKQYVKKSKYINIRKVS